MTEADLAIDRMLRDELSAADPGPTVNGMARVSFTSGSRSGTARIKAQVDRVTRDWIMAHNPAAAPWAFSPDSTVSWHEGQKLLEIVDLTDAEVVPVWGTRVRKIAGLWYAPDAEGVYES